MFSVVKSNLKLEICTWDDPGSYPNSVASAPLPSYNYIENIIGEIVIANPCKIQFPKEIGDDYFDVAEYYDLSDMIGDVISELNNENDCDIRINKWYIETVGDNLVFTVSEFE